MGANAIKTSADVKARKASTYHLLKDIETLDYLLERDLFPKDTIRIGAEQELAISDDKMNPACKAMEVLEAVENKLFTTELSQFNIELNLEPHVLQGQARLRRSRGGCGRKLTAVVAAGFLKLTC